MSLRIRGQEATVRFSVDGQPLAGSFLKAQDFTLTPREELPEADFLGERQSDFDYRHDGFDFSFSSQVTDRSAFDFLRDVSERDRQGLPYPRITCIIIVSFREAGTRSMQINMPNVFMRMTDTAFSGRKDYVTHSFEGKARSAQFREI